MKSVTEAIAGAARAWRELDYAPRQAAVKATLEAPNRFTQEALAFAINQQMHLLSSEALLQWRGNRRAASPMTVGVLNAGNVPLAGLQDLLAVLIMGHVYRGVVSSKSPFLLPAFASSLQAECPDLDCTFAGVEAMWTSVSAVIATGSDATRAWCRGQAHRSGIPQKRCLLRGHRFGIAILDGKEADYDCDGLAEDTLLHEGIGCRNTALIFAPRNLSPDRYLDHFAAFRGVFPAHVDTPGSLAVARAYMQAIEAPHAYGDGLEFLISKGEALVQKPGHVRWVAYDSMDEVVQFVTGHQNEIQCIAARLQVAERLPAAWPTVRLGDTQRPPLDWCPDGRDIIDFLVSLY